MGVKVTISALLLVLFGACVGRPLENASGEEIYLQLCARCHADNLEGFVGPPLGPGSNAAMQPDEFLWVTIEQGRGRMPSFSSSLNNDQLGRLIVYIRGLQGE